MQTLKSALLLFLILAKAVISQTTNCSLQIDCASIGPGSLCIYTSAATATQPALGSCSNPNNPNEISQISPNSTSTNADNTDNNTSSSTSTPTTFFTPLIIVVFVLGGLLLILAPVSIYLYYFGYFGVSKRANNDIVKGSEKPILAVLTFQQLEREANPASPISAPLSTIYHRSIEMNESSSVNVLNRQDSSESVLTAVLSGRLHHNVSSIQFLPSEERYHNEASASIVSLSSVATAELPHIEPVSPLILRSYMNHNDFEERYRTRFESSDPIILAHAEESIPVVAEVGESTDVLLQYPICLECSSHILPHHPGFEITVPPLAGAWFHSTCFHCDICKCEFSESNPFVPFNGRVFCEAHYEQLTQQSMY